ncbi:MAG: hypothetical protein K6F93_06340 [Lachnospiraceae bacterium]|nr:hypothetical protein [Lachnospiraceae bacterium]
MRIEIFTGTLIVILSVLLVVGEMALIEHRSVMRMYNRFSDAVEVAVDDACEYLGPVASDNEIDLGGAEYIEEVFLESLAAALGLDSSVAGKKLADMTDLFVISNGKGLMLVHRTSQRGKWKTFENVETADEAADIIMQNTGKKFFLPDKTGLIQNKAAEGMSVLVLTTFAGGRGITGNRNFICIRNSQLKRKVS